MNKMGEIKCSCGNIIRFLGNRLLSKKSCPKCGKKISSIQPVTESDEQEKCQAHASKKIAGKHPCKRKNHRIQQSFGVLSRNRLRKTRQDP